MEPKPYIELFHLDALLLEQGSKEAPEFRRLAGVVRCWEEDGYEFHFKPEGNFDDPLPVSTSTPVLIGGAVWGMCVQERVRQLREQGYDASANQALSIDSFRDLKYARPRSS
jgi:hypothetical protein